MATRYTNSQLLTTSTDDTSLKEVIENRGLKTVQHYNTANLRYPTTEEINSFVIVKHTWKSSDKFWKLSSTYYGDPKYWWVIAWFNQKPIEALVNVGDVLSIPQPIGDVLGTLG